MITYVWMLIGAYFIQYPGTNIVTEDFWTVEMESLEACQELQKRVPEGASQEPVAHGAWSQCRLVTVVSQN